MNLLLPVILVITSVISWWLSGFDSKLTGDGNVQDIRRRIIRCAITVLLMALGVEAALGPGRFGGFVYIAFVLPLALIWVGCASEVLARGFHSLIDSPGATDFNPKQLSADLDRVAALAQQGRNGEAIELCAKLVKSGEASGLAMETMLIRLYNQAFEGEGLLLSPALAEAHRMCEQNRFAEAESCLHRLLKREPENLGSAMMLSRIYVQHSRRPEKAYALLQDLEHQSGVPPFFVKYARQRVGAWLDPRREEEKSIEGIESLLVGRKHRRGPEERPPSART